MNTFKDDLAFGEKYQHELVKILKPSKYIMSEGNFKYYDIIMTIDYFDLYYEVKTCRIGYKTKNICIEYECSGKKSGISSTHADYYAYFIVKPDETYELYIINVDDIKEVVIKKSYIKIVNCGDNFKSKAYLFNKDIFEKYLFIF